MILVRLIDADALEPDAEYDDGEYLAYSRTQIENAPTIEPERKKGRWVYLPRIHGIDTSTRTYSYPFCSECGHEHPVANFCQNCGADMRVET